MRRLQMLLAAAATAALTGGATARAAELVIGTTGATDRGAINSQAAFNAGQPWKVTSNSWQVRWTVLTSFAEATRNYTLFQIPALPASESITAATVSFPHPSDSYDSVDPTETVTLWSIDSTAPNTLRTAPTAPGVGNLASAFADLGSGTVFGTLVASEAINSTTQTIPLNAAARAAINAVAHGGGGPWGFGGSLTSATPPGSSNTERVFKGASGDFNVNLTVLRLTTSTGSAVPALPEHYTWLLAAVLTGTALLFGSRRRTRTAASADRSWTSEQ